MPAHVIPAAGLGAVSTSSRKLGRACWRAPVQFDTGRIFAPVVVSETPEGAIEKVHYLAAEVRGFRSREIALVGVPRLICAAGRHPVGA